MNLVWPDFLYFWKINLFLEELAKRDEASWAITRSVHGGKTLSGYQMKA